MTPDVSADDQFGLDDAVNGVGDDDDDDDDDDERGMVKTGNMRRGGVGDIGVFPREYQSGTSAPQEMLQASRKWGRLPAKHNCWKNLSWNFTLEEAVSGKSKSGTKCEWNCSP